VANRGSKRMLRFVDSTSKTHEMEFTLFHCSSHFCCYWDHSDSLCYCCLYY
ncbi:unnamed protein product, partial [Strongylus vulgaris]